MHPDHPRQARETSKMATYKHRIAVLSMTTRLAILLGLASSCGGDSGNGPTPLTYDDTGVLDAGYTGTGFASFSQSLDPQFRYLYFNESLPEGPWTCATDGYCGLGGLTNQFGAITAPDSFVFVSTANFVFPGPDTVVVVVSSGVEAGNGLNPSGPLTIPNPSQYDSLRVSFEWAFLTSRLDSPTHNDSIVVRIRTASDSTTLFKVTAADLEAGTYPEKAGGCGVHAVIPGSDITYNHCTDWAAKTVDVTRFLTSTFGIEFIVSEGGQSLTDPDDKPSAFLFRKLKLEGGK
jgi:hypothetical protein